MPNSGTYYIGRLLKQGFDKDDLINVLLESPVIRVGQYSWTINDPFLNDGGDFVYGKLTKFSEEGEVAVVDTGTHRSVSTPQPDLIVAQSPFVYLPAFSGVAFLHVWNNIEYQTFRKRFTEIIKEGFQHFFAECTVEMISDLRSFVARVGRLTDITRMQARVEPPNPLFGRFWKSLDEYLRRRQLNELKIDERANESIKNRLAQLLNDIVEDVSSDDELAVDIGDAAILMAADGYGSGRIEGKEAQRAVTLKTDDTKVMFRDEREIEPAELYRRTYEILEAIQRERYMEEE